MRGCDSFSLTISTFSVPRARIPPQWPAGPQNLHEFSVFDLSHTISHILTQSRPEFHQSENAAVEKIPKRYNRKVILNINIIYFWTWAVLISTKSSRAHFQLFSCLAIFWDLGRKEEKTTCKVTWAKDRRAGETRKLFEHAADVRDSANTEYSTLSHIESCPLNEICPVCVWV